MKTRYLIVFLLLTGTLLYAQTPDAFKYQAVLKNGSGEILANTTVALRISVLQDSDVGAVVYDETFHPTTNAHGLVDIEIGGDPFHTIEWKAHLFWLKVEVDPSNGSSFTHLGTSQLLAVPYALNAMTVEFDAVDDADPDPDNELQTISLDGLDLSLSQGGGTVVLPSGGGADNWGSQVVESDATLSGEGTSGDPLGVVGDLTDDQTLSVAGNDLTISDGNTVPLPSSPWLFNASDIYYSAGNVGIGVSSPTFDFHVYGNSMFDVGTGNIQIATPGSYPGLIAFENATGHRRDIAFRPEGVGIHVSTSSSSPGINDAIWIKEGGNLGIQTAASGNYPLFINQRQAFGLALNHETSAELWEIYSQSDGYLGLYRSGSIFRGSFHPTSGVYSPVSDRRAKTDIKPLNSSLDDVVRIKPSTYKMKGDFRGNREIGLVAQELKKHFPELVYEINDKKSGKTLHTVNYNGIAVVAVKAIQEQQEIIEAQEDTIDKLSERIGDLERRLESLQRSMKRIR